MMDSSSRPHFCERSATSWLVSSMLLLAAGLCSGVRQGLVPPSSHSWTNYCLPPSVIQPLFNWTLFLNQILLEAQQLSWPVFMLIHGIPWIFPSLFHIYFYLSFPETLAIIALSSMCAAVNHNKIIKWKIIITTLFRATIKVCKNINWPVSVNWMNGEDKIVLERMAQKTDGR